MAACVFRSKHSAGTARGARFHVQGRTRRLIGSHRNTRLSMSRQSQPGIFHRFNVREHRVAAGRQARVGESFPRTTSTDLVACLLRPA